MASENAWKSEYIRINHDVLFSLANLKVIKYKIPMHFVFRYIKSYQNKMQ